MASAFTDWLAAAGYSQTGVNTSVLAKDWLQTWSLDLNVLKDDHTVRNEASYRPHSLHYQTKPFQWDTALSTVADFWRGCEPSQFSTFSVLDLHLLRQALHRTHQVHSQ